MKGPNELAAELGELEEQIKNLLIEKSNLSAKIKAVEDRISGLRGNMKPICTQLQTSVDAKTPRRIFRINQTRVVVVVELGKESPTIATLE